MGNHSLPLSPLYQVEGPETCWTPKQEGLEFGDRHSNLPFCDAFTRARLPEGFQARKTSKPSSYVSKR